MLRAKTDHLGLLPPLAETGFKISTLQEEGAEVDSLSPVVQLIVWTLDKPSFLKTFAFFFFLFIYIYISPFILIFNLQQEGKTEKVAENFFSLLFLRGF